MFPLDEKYIETPLTARGYTVWHRLEWPTKVQLIERDSRIKSEEITRRGRIETIYDDDDANTRCWNECARAVRGYNTGNGHSANDWVEITEEIRARMPSEHKMKAVAALFILEGTIIPKSQDGDGYPMYGADEIPIVLEIGNVEALVYTHVFRAPTESEWNTYHRNALRIYQVRGAKDSHWISNPNLSAATTLYDALLTRIEGATLGGQEFEASRRDEFVRAVNPSHKRAVVRTFADHWSADLANSESLS